MRTLATLASLAILMSSSSAFASVGNGTSKADCAAAAAANRNENPEAAKQRVMSALSVHAPKTKQGHSTNSTR